MRSVIKAIVTLLQAMIVCFVLGSLAASVVPTTTFSLLQILPSLDMFVWIVSVVMVVMLIAFRQRTTIGTVGIVLLTTLIFYRGHSNHDLTDSNGEKTVRILTLNVRQLSNDTAVVDKTIAMLREVNADIICLQEFGLYYKWPEVEAVSWDFANRLGVEHYDFTPHPGNIFGTAVFSKVPIERIDTLFSLLSHTNEAKRYRFNIEGESLILSNVHLQSYNLLSLRDRLSFSSIREAIIQRSNQAHIVASIPSDVIVGDMNASPGSEVYAMFTESYFDASAAAGNAFLPTHQLLPARLDHVFLKPGANLISVERLEGFPSDHHALLLEIAW